MESIDHAGIGEKKHNKTEGVLDPLFIKYFHKYVTKLGCHKATLCLLKLCCMNSAIRLLAGFHTVKDMLYVGATDSG